VLYITLHNKTKGEFVRVVGATTVRVRQLGQRLFTLLRGTVRRYLVVKAEMLQLVSSFIPSEWQRKFK